MTQYPIDDIFVGIKMTFRSVKFRNLESPDSLKLCLNREKPIYFSEEICLIRAVFCQYLRRKFQFLRNLPLQLRETDKIKHKNKR